MLREKNTIGKNIIECEVNSFTGAIPTIDDVINSWHNNVHIEVEGGLRKPQKGALYAIKSFWTTNMIEPATIVMPTGTGKTETMICAVLSEKINKTVIVVPNKLLRRQTVDKFLELEVLRKHKVIKDELLAPIVAELLSAPKNEKELRDIIDRSNIIITTPKILVNLGTLIEVINGSCDLLIFDEAHHVSAFTWTAIKNSLGNLKILQFTATPFRNDNELLDGKIIYNYSLADAQKDGYFEIIDFHAIEEFDPEKSDLEIAKHAISILKRDISNGFEHILLVRGKDQGTAKRLFENIYLKEFPEYNPVLIMSGMSRTSNEESMKCLRAYESKIVVCVDMFGEGIDIPNLKIAAIHSKYKSLPITLQFIGRFARTKEKLGAASIVANIVDEEVRDSISSLYDYDSDWNVLLPLISNKAVEKEVKTRDFINDFDIKKVGDVLLSQIKPKVSLIPYKTSSAKWNIENLKEKFDHHEAFISINRKNNVIVYIEKVNTKLSWSRFKGMYDVNWHLHLIYWNKETQMVYVNSTSKGKISQMMDVLFDDYYPVIGEDIFRCLFDIKRLMLGTVGLNSGINGPIRYKMFAGIDVAEGLSESQKMNTFRSNLFGYGYNGKGRVSIGCSYKGTIWSRWVETMDYWTDWCNHIGVLINDSSIDTERIFDGVLIPQLVTSFPGGTAYCIEWPVEMFQNEDNTYLVVNKENFLLYECDIKIVFSSIDTVMFNVETIGHKQTIEMKFNGNKVLFKYVDGDAIEIVYKEEKFLVSDFFNNYPPKVKFSDQKILEGNLMVSLNLASPNLDKGSFIPLDWDSIDITKESMGFSFDENNIQAYMVKYLKKQNDFNILFNDDGPGEIADIVAIDSNTEEVIIHMYHCKYSSEIVPGARVSDFYEVCGQAEKSINWLNDPLKVIDRMIKREVKTLRNNNTRFLKGSLRELRAIQNKLKFHPVQYKMSIVQPGLSISQSTSNINTLLSGVSSYLKDTYSIDLKIYCSK